MALYSIDPSGVFGADEDESAFVDETLSSPRYPRLVYSSDTSDTSDTSVTPEVNVPPTQAPPIMSPEFHAVMSRMDRHMSPARAARALQTWHLLCANASPPEPILEVLEDGLRFAWSTPAAYLDIEVHDDGFDWFFRDKATPSGVGNEERRTDIPPDAIRLLGRFR